MSNVFNPKLYDVCLKTGARIGLQGYQVDSNTPRLWSVRWMDHDLAKVVGRKLMPAIVLENGVVQWLANNTPFTIVDDYINCCKMYYKLNDQDILLFKLKWIITDSVFLPNRFDVDRLIALLDE